MRNHPLNPTNDKSLFGHSHKPENLTFLISENAIDLEKIPLVARMKGFEGFQDGFGVLAQEPLHTKPTRQQC